MSRQKNASTDPVEDRPTSRMTWYIGFQSAPSRAWPADDQNGTEEIA